MLILMVKKYATLLMGLAAIGAVAGPMAYFHFFDRGKTPSQASGRRTASGRGAVCQLRSSGLARRRGRGHRNHGEHCRSGSAGHAGRPAVERARARCRQRLRFPNHARMDRGPLAGRFHRTGPASVGGLSRAAGHGHGPARSGRIADLLLQCRAETSADHLHRHDGRPSTVDRAVDRAIPLDPAAGRTIRAWSFTRRSTTTISPPAVCIFAWQPSSPTTSTGATTSSFPW